MNIDGVPAWSYSFNKQDWVTGPRLAASSEVETDPEPPQAHPLSSASALRIFLTGKVEEAT